MDSYELDDSEWEPEPLPLAEQLESPRPTPRHDDTESDHNIGSRVIVIDLA
jgi:hypothetical protein